MSAIILLDLDGCIADDLWRRHLILRDDQEPVGQQRWEDYHEASIHDPCNTVGIRRDGKILIVTGRPETYRELTKAWLYTHRVFYHALLMRAEGDHRPAPQVKRSLVLDYFQHSDGSIKDIVMAYDDRLDVLAMYQQLGIPTTRKIIHPEQGETKE